jgi:peptidoglycan/xylan/chitin deacetylase (PgdA/CDA1 family)
VHMKHRRQERKKRVVRQVRRLPWMFAGLCLVALVGALALHSSGYAGVIVSGIRGRLEARFPGNGPGDTDPAVQAGDDGPGHKAGEEPGGEPDIAAAGESGNGSECGPSYGDDGRANDRDDDPAAPMTSPMDDGELARLRVNELGKVPIIMYHDVQDYEAEWVRSRSNFRKDLERFHDLGYSLVLLSDYLEGKISVPAGRSPLVLTFDDGTRGQFRLVEGDDGLIPDPDCAVGILLEFSRAHPDFGHAATFFVNAGNPFGDPSQVEEKFKFLLENGMEIGNHTRSHENLAYVSPEVVAREIGSLANEVRDVCGYETVSLALPYGGYPRSTENLLTGTWDGQEYANKGVLLVGAEPAPSPFSKRFDPLAIPRIRGSQEELDKWRGQFEKYPEGRFVSDGRSDTVTVREGDEGDLDAERVGNRTIRTYALPAAAGSGDTRSE